MAKGLTLDSGALIAAEKNVRRFWVMLDEACERGALVTVPSVVLAQIWRGNDALVARLLQACEVEELDQAGAKRVGALLAKSRTSDVIDAAVAVGAAARKDAILTSDPEDMERLVAATGSGVRVLRI